MTEVLVVVLVVATAPCACVLTTRLVVVIGAMVRVADVVCVVTTGLDAVHGVELVHNPCFLRESVNPFVTKLVTSVDRSEALPASRTVT